MRSPYDTNNKLFFIIYYFDILYLICKMRNFIWYKL